MRLPGFTAERNIRQVVPSYSEAHSAVGAAAINGLAGSGGLGYVCTPDNRACSCSGADDCLNCARDPKACGDITKGCICTPKACGCA